MAVFDGVIPAIIGAANATSAGYEINRSLRFNSADSAYLNRTPSSAGNRKTFTHSFWVKRSEIGNQKTIFSGNTASNFNTGWQIVFRNDDMLQIGGSSPSFTLITNQVFRDPGAWYHIVVSTDTTQSTSSDRVKLYVNGTQITVFSTETYPSQNVDLNWNGAFYHQISSHGYATNVYLDGYLAEIHFIDSQALAASDFGEYDDNNVWQPKKFTGTHNPAQVGIIYSSGVSSPDGTIAASPNDATALFNGDTTTNCQTTTNGTTVRWTPPTTVSWSTSLRIYTGPYSGSVVVRSNGTDYTLNSNGSQVPSPYWLTHPNSSGTIEYIDAQGHIGAGVGYMKAIEVDGTILEDGTPAGVNGFHLPFSDNSSNQALGYDAAVTAPTLNPRGGMDAITYTGNGSTKSITGLAFQPDFVWIKNRTDSTSHMLFDSVRGVKKVIYSNADTQENPANISLTSYDPNGFTVSSANEVNGNNDNIIAWCWKAGGSAVSNSDGTITSQVSASTDYGFSVVSYTGDGSGTDTVGHGLNAAPSLVITKSRGTTGSWRVFIDVGGTLKLGNLNNNDAFVNASVSAPTSSVFSVDGNSNTSTTHIAYCWSEVSGFSKFGSYSGNGSTQKLTFGFKPAFVMIKRYDSSTGGDWYMFDDERISGTGENLLRANTNAAEDSAYDYFSFDDDGITLTTGNTLNGSGRSYIYAAFADRPGNNWTPNNLIAEAGLETASQGFDVRSGLSAQFTISDLNFQPDLIVAKSTSNSEYWIWVDSVRGFDKVLKSNTNDAENSGGAAVTSVGSSGFTSSSNWFTTGRTYATWCWKAGGTAVSNTDGSITSSVSANTTYGFSIVSFVGTGANGSIGHGLNAAPEFIIAKNRDSVDNWFIYHSAIGANGYILLNQTSAADTSNSTVWQNVTPTSSVFSASTGGYNDSGDNVIAYCWSEVSGFSKFGSYTGNGSTTGPVVTLGFKPRFILVRSTSSNRGWVIWDTARDTNTTNDNNLFPNNDSAESSSSDHNLIIRDDGFQLATTSVNRNGSGETYIYAAFAGKPPGEIIDSLIDTPTNYEASSGNNGGNYATLNPLSITYGSGTLTNGNLELTPAGGDWTNVNSTFAITSEKVYFEATGTDTPNSSRSDGARGAWIGLRRIKSQSNWAKNGTDTHSLILNDMGYLRNGGSGFDAIGAKISNGDVVGFAYDGTNGTYEIFFNGVSKSSGSVSTTSYSAGDEMYVATAAYPDSGGIVYGNFTLNFGQRPFAYTPPTGFLSLCTTNLPDPTIADGSTAMDVALYTGNGSTQTISGLGFSPDLVWMKMRSTAGYSHKLVDQVRGATKSLVSNNTNAELTETSGLTAFTSDGFNLGSQDPYNRNNDTFVAWAWDAGSSTVTNTDGSITSQVRAYASAGFSIVTWTGNSGTVGHGLNAAPGLIISKIRNTASVWPVQHSYDTSQFLTLNTTNAASSGATYFGAAPTSSVFSVGSWWNSDSQGIAYCFAPVAGYSSFGSYVGNGSSDGPMVFTGFRVAWLMTKRTDTSENWEVRDSTRNPHNRTNLTLFPHSDGAEDSGSVDFDLLSNGFKLRNTNGSTNANGGTYLYAAFAENPFKTARAR